MKSSVRSETNNNNAKPKKSIEWDEVAIAEHDLTRGTRMTIDEPKTPFAYDSEMHDEENNDGCQVVELDQNQNDGKDCYSQKGQVHLSDQWGSLENKLKQVAQQKEIHGDDFGVLGRTPHSTPVDTEKKSSDAFKKKMKAHYNEVEVLRRFRALHPDGIDDDDEEDEDVAGD